MEKKILREENLNLRRCRSGYASWGVGGRTSGNKADIGDGKEETRGDTCLDTPSDTGWRNNLGSSIGGGTVVYGVTPLVAY